MKILVKDMMKKIIIFHEIHALQKTIPLVMGITNLFLLIFLHLSYLRITSVAFVPPKPKLFDITVVSM